MSFIDALAVIGGVTGPVAAGAEVYAVRRDRPQLTVNFGYREQLGALPRVWITILNHGRQPITIREAGFYGSELPVQIKSQDLGILHGTATYEFKLVNSPVLLDPGHMHEATAGVPDSPDQGYHVDFPLRAYATDARGRRTWGEAAPVVRMVVGQGDCPPGFPEHLWNPTRDPLMPARVEPRWKLWSRAELRRGDSGRPTADELKAATSPSSAGSTKSP